jgi:hypothetical protein
VVNLEVTIAVLVEMTSIEMGVVLVRKTASGPTGIGRMVAVVALKRNDLIH